MVTLFGIAWFLLKAYFGGAVISFLAVASVRVALLFKCNKERLISGGFWFHIWHFVRLPKNKFTGCAYFALGFAAAILDGLQVGLTFPIELGIMIYEHYKPIIGMKDRDEKEIIEKVL